MKQKLMILAVIALGTMQALAWADAPTGTSPANANHPCKQIVAACQAAGYFKGGHKEKKGLFKDCMGPVMSGQSVPGVTVDASTVQACQARKAAHKAH